MCQILGAVWPAFLGILRACELLRQVRMIRIEDEVFVANTVYCAVLTREPSAQGTRERHRYRQDFLGAGRGGASDCVAVTPHPARPPRETLRLTICTQGAVLATSAHRTQLSPLFRSRTLRARIHPCMGRRRGLLFQTCHRRSLASFCVTREKTSGREISEIFDSPAVHRGAGRRRVRGARGALRRARLLDQAIWVKFLSSWAARGDARSRR